jgi:GNAT superfamily N-acetyltransferase
MTGFTIDEVRIPTTLDGSPEALDFEGAVDARNAAEVAGFGTADVVYTAAELLPGWQPSDHEKRRLIVARVDGRVVARGVYETRLEGDSMHIAWLQAQVHPDFTGRGIGRAISDELERLTVDEGRTQIQVYTPSPPGQGPRLEPPTGFGSVPAENREVRFLLARGYSLEQVERASRLTLPVDQALFDERMAGVLKHSADYRVHLWDGRAPKQWLEDLAVLATRMSTDAPSGGIDEVEDVWTVERWLDEEDQQADSPRVTIHAAVEHIPSGKLVGYTDLSVPPELDRPADQGDTIVMREHRGHRLGMLLKLSNIAHLEQKFPGHSAITTYNAEENRPMLDVNEAVGFEPFAYEGVWQKKL